MFDIFEIYCCAHLIYCQAYFFPKYDEKCWKKGDSKKYISQCYRMTWLQCLTKRSGKDLWISKPYFDPCWFLESAITLKWKPHWQKFGNFLSRKFLIYKFIVLVLLSVGSFTTDPSGGWSIHQRLVFRIFVISIVRLCYFLIYANIVHEVHVQKSLFYELGDIFCFHVANFVF